MTKSTADMVPASPTGELPPITLSASPADSAPASFAVSVPLPRGAYPVGRAWQLRRRDDGTVLPLQTRTLATWPDGSLRWLHALGVTAVGGVADLELLPEIARDTSSDTAERAPADSSAWLRRSADGSVKFGTKGLVATVRPDGPSPLAALSLGNTPLIDACDGFQARLVLADGREAIFGDGEREITVCEDGPVRVTVRIVGHLARATGEALLHYRLDMSVTAGQTGLTVDFRFLHDRLGVPHMDISELTLQLRPARGNSPVRHLLRQRNRGMLCLTTDIVTARQVDLRSGLEHSRCYVADTACLEETETMPAFMPDIFDHCDPLVAIGLADAWLTVAPDDFVEQTPQALVASDGVVDYHILPPWAEPVRLPQGRARRLRLQLLADGGEAAPAFGTLLGRLAARRDEGARAALPPAWYAAHAGWGADLQMPTGPNGLRRFDRYLRKLGALPTVLGMWELGDTPELGYTRTYVGNHSVRRFAEPPLPRFTSEPHYPLAYWSRGLTHEIVWSNNEYDAILAITREWFRAPAGAEHWRRLGWFARHAVDVDFVHVSDSPQLLGGTPAHSADHQRATAYPSHLWAEGLLAWYCLSGDDDALEVARAQGDFILRSFSAGGLRDRLWGFSRELGWALLHLAVLADFTGETRFAEGADELAAALISHPRDATTRQNMVVGAFGYVSVVLGVTANWQRTGDPALAAWIVDVAHEVADLVLNDGLTCVEPVMVLPYFTAAWKVSGDDNELRPGLHVLEAVLDSHFWREPKQEAKAIAMLHRGLSTWLGPAHRAGLLDDFDYRHYPGTRT